MSDDIKFYSWGKDIYEIARDVNHPIKSIFRFKDESDDYFEKRAMKMWDDFFAKYTSKPNEEINIIKRIP